uniref:Uncharacterized protein n=1 Tax=Populus trichocarpa TaxID=3694 RepID=A0A2K2AE09_POPTR
MKSNINVLGAGMMKFDKSRQICYSFHGYSSFLQYLKIHATLRHLIVDAFSRLGRGGLGDDTSSWTYSFILLNKAGYLLLCSFLFVQRLPVGQNCR